MIRLDIRPHGQAVKTLPSQGKITSSILVGATIHLSEGRCFFYFCKPDFSL